MVKATPTIQLSTNRDQVYHNGTTQDHLDRFEDQWKNLWVNRRSRKRACLLTTCSHAKPYSKSYIHSMIRHKLWEEQVLQSVDIVHVSSAGIIPEAAGAEYPFNAYDWNDATATAEERDAYVKRLAERFTVWEPQFENYDAVLAYFNPDDDNLRYLSKEKRITVVQTLKAPPLPWALVGDVDDCLTKPRNLDNLVTQLRMKLKYSGPRI